MRVFLCYNVVMDLDDYLTALQATIKLWNAGVEVDTRTVQRWCKTGRLAARKVGSNRRGVWLIDPDSLQRVIEEETESE